MPPHARDPGFTALPIGTRYSEHRTTATHKASWGFDDRHPLYPRAYPQPESSLTQLRAENSVLAMAGLSVPTLADAYRPTLQARAAGVVVARV